MGVRRNSLNKLTLMGLCHADSEAVPVKDRINGFWSISSGSYLLGIEAQPVQTTYGKIYTLMGNCRFQASCDAYFCRRTLRRRTATHR